MVRHECAATPDAALAGRAPQQQRLLAAPTGPACSSQRRRDAGLRLDS
jgi:hypothetical protein